MAELGIGLLELRHADLDRKSTRLNSSHLGISYAVFCLKKKNNNKTTGRTQLLAPTTAHCSMRAHVGHFAARHPWRSPWLRSLCWLFFFFFFFFKKRGPPRSPPFPPPPPSPF